MRNGLVDLHLHSKFSCDGDFLPEELARMARDNGFRAIAIADHDTVAGYPKAIEAGQKYGVEVISSIELTTIFDSREFHLLLPLVNWKSKTIKSLVSQMKENRMEEAKVRVQRLREIGLELDWDEVWTRSGQNPPLGVKIAQILLDKPENRQNPRLKKYYDQDGQPFAPFLFYQDFFAEGGLAYVPKKYPKLEEVLKLAPLTGGVPVLSHPGAYFQLATREDLTYLKEIGLQGLEVYTSYHHQDEIEYYKKIAEELDLVITAGSDFHGRIKPGVKFGLIKEGDYSMVERLRERKS
ncbi:MAG: PHP domain-containing protein [Acidobacteriota bacterium]|nr:PHP domain-containing protein [Acidobacteriota bacterium]MDW3229697.1 PHP domain-containing protein [Acidobacteriota bacterium]